MKDTLRKREEFAVSLRASKRQEMLQSKRRALINTVFVSSLKKGNPEEQAEESPADSSEAVPSFMPKAEEERFEEALKHLNSSAKALEGNSKPTSREFNTLIHLFMNLSEVLRQKPKLMSSKEALLSAGAVLLKHYSEFDFEIAKLSCLVEDLTDLAKAAQNSNSKIIEALSAGVVAIQQQALSPSSGSTEDQQSSSILGFMDILTHGVKAGVKLNSEAIASVAIIMDDAFEEGSNSLIDGAALRALKALLKHDEFDLNESFKSWMKAALEHNQVLAETSGKLMLLALDSFDILLQSSKTSQSCKAELRGLFLPLFRVALKKEQRIRILKKLFSMAIYFAKESDAASSIATLLEAVNAGVFSVADREFYTWIRRSEFRNWLLAVTPIMDYLDDEEAGRVFDLVMRNPFNEGVSICQENKWEEELEHLQETMDQFVPDDSSLGPIS